MFVLVFLLLLLVVKMMMVLLLLLLMMMVMMRMVMAMVHCDDDGFVGDRCLTTANDVPCSDTFDDLFFKC